MQVYQEEMVRPCNVWPCWEGQRTHLVGLTSHLEMCAAWGMPESRMLCRDFQSLSSPLTPIPWYYSIWAQMLLPGEINQCMLGAVELESSFAKDLGILVDIMSQQRVHAARKVNGIFGYIRPSIASRSKVVIIYWVPVEATPGITSQSMRHMIYWRGPVKGQRNN